MRTGRREFSGAHPRIGDSGPSWRDYARSQLLEGLLWASDDHFERSWGVSVDSLLDFRRLLERKLTLDDAEVSALHADLICNRPVLLFSEDSEESELAEAIIQRELSILVAGRSKGEVPKDLPERFHAAWKRLVARKEAGRPLVDVDLDGRPEVQTALERIATEILSSVDLRSEVLAERQRIDAQYRNDVEPRLAKEHPQLHTRLEKIRTLLTPRALSEGGERLRDLEPSPQDVRKAFELLTRPVKGRDPSPRALDRFAQLAVGLSDATLTGAQTYWVKMLREVVIGGRRRLVQICVQAFGALILGNWDGASAGQVLPDDCGGRGLSRGASMGRLMRQTLFGLGIDDRRAAHESISAMLFKNRQQIADREAALRKQFGEDYCGIDLDPAMLMRPNLDAVQRAQESLRALPLTGAVDCHLALMELLEAVLRAPADLPIEVSKKSALPTQPVILSDFFGAGAPKILKADAIPAELALEERSGPGISLVFEGGGGKGFVYPALVDELSRGLAPVDAPIDELLGTSAGAIVAGLMAAGYRADGLDKLLQELDFTRFFDGFFGMMGCVDPAVRGIDHNGLFSTETMYRTVSKLLADKLGIEDRPVLFSDLPTRLKVFATVVGGDAPQALLDQLGVERDGTIVFSQDTTPNMDVAAAICASAAVPGFFQAPQVRICVPERSGFTQYRLQLADGGVLNNLPAARSLSESDRDLMVMIPAPCDGLQVADFDPARAQGLEAKNRESLRARLPALSSFLKSAFRDGSKRATLAFNLTDEASQPELLIQGRTSERSHELRALADSVGLSSLSEEEAREVVDENINRDSLETVGFQYVVNALLDGREDQLSPSLFGERAYRPARGEAETFWSILRAVLSARLVSSQRSDENRFEGIAA